MRLDELIRDLRGDGEVDEISYARLATAAGGKPAAPSFVRHGAVPKSEDFEETPWHTRRVMRTAIDADSAIGIARAFSIPPRTVWLATGESLGLPGMFGDSLDEAVATLPPGWHRLDYRRLALLRQVASVLIREQQQEEQVAELEARVAELEPPAQSTKSPRRRSPRV